MGTSSSSFPTEDEKMAEIIAADAKRKEDLRIKQEKEAAERAAHAAKAKEATTTEVYTVIKTEGDAETQVEASFVNATTVAELKVWLFQTQGDVPPPDQVRVKNEKGEYTSDGDSLGSLGSNTVRACYKTGARAQYEEHEAKRTVILAEQEKRRKEVDAKIRDGHLKHNRSGVRVCFEPVGRPMFKLDLQTVNGETTLRQCKQEFLKLNDTLNQPILPSVPPPEMWTVTCKRKTGENHVTATAEYGPEIEFVEDEAMGMCPEFENDCVLTITFKASEPNLYADPQQVTTNIGVGAVGGGSV